MPLCKRTLPGVYSTNNVIKSSRADFADDLFEQSYIAGFYVLKSMPRSTIAFGFPSSSSATLALRIARNLLRDEYMDVRVCTLRGRILQSDELEELEPQLEMNVIAAIRAT